MNALRPINTTADNAAQPTTGIVKVIECKFGDIEIIDGNRFHIAEFAKYGSPYFCPDTQELDAIIAILNRPDWTEAEVNDALAELCEAEECLQRTEGE